MKASYHSTPKGVAEHWLRTTVSAAFELRPKKDLMQKPRVDRVSSAAITEGMKGIKKIPNCYCISGGQDSKIKAGSSQVLSLMGSTEWLELQIGVDAEHASFLRINTERDLA